jgi:monoglucosyldiacylglycerol epimerase
MDVLMDLAWEHVPRLILQAAALFVFATFVFDAIHFGLHLCLKSRWASLRRLASPHQAHHDFCDRRLIYHDKAIVPNLVLHVIPEYATQMAVCALSLTVLDPSAVIVVMGGFTLIFACVMILRGKDRNHVQIPILPAAHGSFFVRAPYHALHHVHPENYMSSYTTIFDRLMGTACQIRGRRIALTGASGAFGAAMKSLLERAGAIVIPLKFAVDWNYDDYSGADSVLDTVDILILAHGAKGASAMQANCDSFLALIERFRALTRHRQFPIEIWAVGSEIECHPTFGKTDLLSYARSKRAYARAAAQLMCDQDVLYRHIVPSSFRSRMGPGLMSARTCAVITLWLIRRGFQYVPVTYTGIALLNFIPFFIRTRLTGSDRSLRDRSPLAISTSN